METEKTSNVNEQKGLFGSLITEELDGNLVVIGYPHHEGAGRARKYKGQDNGPGNSQLITTLLFMSGV